MSETTGNCIPPTKTLRDRMPLWLVAMQPRVVRGRIRDWLWLRRVRQANADPGESIADYIVRTTTEQSDARDQLNDVWEAHEWQCDCTPDDPCRIAIALRSGPR